MRLYRVGGAVGLVVLLGACEVHVGSGPPPPPPGPTPPAPQNLAHATPPPPPAPPAASPPPPPTPHPPSPVRLAHPAPLANQTSGPLDGRALNPKLKPNRRCGPRESTPGSNHWIHVDCVKYKPLVHAVPAAVTARK